MLTTDEILIRQLREDKQTPIKAMVVIINLGQHFEQPAPAWYQIRRRIRERKIFRNAAKDCWELLKKARAEKEKENGTN